MSPLAKTPTQKNTVTEPRSDRHSSPDEASSGSEAQLDTAPPNKTGGGAGGGLSAPFPDQLPEELLEGLDGATFEDIFARGLKPAPSKSDESISRRKKAVSKVKQPKRKLTGVARKKMGFTVKPLLPQKMVYSESVPSESAASFVAKREGRLNRKTSGGRIGAR